MKQAEKKIVALIDGKRLKISFKDIKQLADERGIPKRYSVGGTNRDNDSVENFARLFTSTYYPQYKSMTFKVNLDWFGVTFWEVASISKSDLYNINKPIL